MTENDNIERRQETGEKKPGYKGRVDRLMFIYHLFLLLVAILFLVIIFFRITTYSIDPYIKNKITPHSTKVKTQPFRGAILAADGSYLAIAVPEYNIYMDCTIRKKDFDASKRDNVLSDNYKKRVARTDADWIEQTKELADSLSVIFPERTPNQWLEYIKHKRYGNPKVEGKGGSHTILKKNVDYTTYIRLKNAFRKAYHTSDPFKTGWIAESVSQENFVRHYPYGPLARRVIGNIPRDGDLHHIGIEGRYNKVLRGEYGHEYHKTVDGKRAILDNDSTIVKANDGYDILTTIDMNFQQVTHSALRRELESYDVLWGGCAIVMEARTGAIRAMVNLQKDEKTGQILENKFEYATRQAGDPGSVFKVFDCMMALEDGKIPSLDKKMPTHNGYYDAGPFSNVKNHKRELYKDKHLFFSEVHSDSIKIIDALKVSSNNVFMELIVNNYGDNPQRYLDRLYGTGLFTSFDFDIDGLATPALPTYGNPNSWSAPTLPNIAIGYSVTLTPLHLVTLYGGIANDGMMMRPYLVEGFMKDGKVCNGMKAGNTGKGVLNASLCSKETAEEIRRGLATVTKKGGTGEAMSSAKCSSIGKTGTARILHNEEINGKIVPVYQGKNGTQYQATFICVWPEEKPKYAAILVAYSKFMRGDDFGGTFFGSRNVDYMKEIVNKTYQLGVLNDDYNERYIH
ncbi:MAG: hypothetical protein HUJ95_04280 [Bacteroidales bacterium]|nr:hypothetical protein [Bacteroidales bacterium]